jgi:hypothetical protein
VRGADCECVMRSIRFITWNCRSGSLHVRLAQLGKYRPDVVFLQECAPTENTPCTCRVNARKSIALVGLSPDFELSPLTASVDCGRASVAASFEGPDAFSVIGICFVPTVWLDGLMNVQVLNGKSWAQHSDHRPLIVDLVPQTPAALRGDKSELHNSACARQRSAVHAPGPP